MKLFSGSANPKLAQSVSDLVGIPLSPVEIVRFDNSETRVRVDENVKNKTCLIIQATSNPTDQALMELFFFCDALRRMEAKRVIAYIPYFGYARQDVQHRPGECVSVNVVIRFMETIGFDKVYTIDLHDEATEGVFKIPFKNLSALSLLAQYTRKHIEEIKNVPIKDLESKVAIVSPDQGGIERARKFGEVFFHDADFRLNIIEKRRNLKAIHQSKALDLYGDVEGKIAIIVDDMTTSGGTLIHAADLCKSRGAKAVIAVVIHHDLGPGAMQKIEASVIDHFFTTDTIKLLPDQKTPKLEEVSVAGLIADEIKKYIHS